MKEPESQSKQSPFERFQDLTRRLLAVPKKEVEELAETEDDFRGKKRKKPNDKIKPVKGLE